MLAYLDCASGISGDKFLAALLDAGEADGSFSTEHLADAIDALGLRGVRVETARVTRSGISGLHVEITAEENPPHRTWPVIRNVIDGASAIPRAARDRALRAFEALAQAEARVHGTTVDKVHFHEVGAADSIIDIVGVSLGLELLCIERLICSKVALGEGTVNCEHGVLPAPAPATLELLRDVPVYGAAQETGQPREIGELTTPTGAALIAANADGFGPMPDMLPSRIGYGAGSRDIAGLPNVARLVLGHPLTTSDSSPTGALASSADADTAGESTEAVVLLETTLDHLSPEQVAFAAEELRDTPALDVWQVPAAMKKGRLGIELRVLAHPGDADKLATRIHELTGTLGVRRTTMDRSVLEREVVTHESTAWGPFRVKVSGSGASERIRPEHDDIARMARETGESYGEVARRLEQEAARPEDDLS